MLNPVPPPEPRRRTKGRATRAESKIKQFVRAACVERDGDCRFWATTDDLWRIFGPCSGESEWAHLEDKRRFRTRGMAPHKRHTTEGSLMLCTGHHRAYDAHEIDIQPATSRGADGPLGFQCGATVYVEPEK